MGTSTSRANWARPRRAGPWRFVRLGRESGKVAEVDEFEVASALFAGERDALSQLTEGRHLFNLCLEFGLDSTALALLEHGVEGCRLEWDDLKGLSSETWSWGSWKGCRCPYGSWQSCSACSWGFPLDNDVWMPDWDADLYEASLTASTLALFPLTEALFNAIRSDTSLPGLEVSNEAMARLLDVAVLLGDKDLALRCADRCPWKPLRRWRVQDLLCWDFNGVSVTAPAVLDAALAVGTALFQLRAPIAMGGLYASYWSYAMSYGSLLGVRGISLREAIVLSGDQKILERVSSYEPDEASRTRHADALLPLGWLLEAEANGRRKVSSTRLELARLSGLGHGRCLGDSVRVQPFWMETTHAGTRERFTLGGCTVLDLCIYGGQTRCAGLAAGMGASLGDLSRVFLEPDCIDLRVWLAHGAMDATCRVRAAPLLQRKAAAAQALGKALKASMHQASQRMGLGLDQALGAWANGKKVPSFLAGKILTFASERPAIANHLQEVAGELGLQWDASQDVPQVLDPSEDMQTDA
ncbi:hypothetical protein AK812_SmicGene658 [Symbiodinium microadriaticum]|uniref:Uncharacterized protein n=1 Tax=Symbiodinium microadriaticum TaxID=2951 RepID=A0A1Q9F5T9_SYMMI|nr:hypothetical protein AK812_SmicGene658 [Symbiodinium microadriaticum]CAE7197056.1 unnamed protein product [Symbiodinium microadriaticum]CAE7199448.1 unnamed protein product [Symbiodinium sp. KB8]